MKMKINAQKFLKEQVERQQQIKQLQQLHKALLTWKVESFQATGDEKECLEQIRKRLGTKEKDYLSEVMVLVSSKNFNTGKFVRELNNLIYNERIVPFFFLNIILDKKIASEDQEYAYRFYTDMVKEAFSQEGLFFGTSAIVFFERDYQLFEEMGLTRETADRICDEVIGMTGAYLDKLDEAISEILESMQQ